MRPEAAVAQAGVQPVELVDGARFAVIGLDDRVTRVHLFDMSVQRAEVALLAGKVFLAAGHDEEHDRKADDRCGNGGQRHDPVGDKHHDQAAEEQHDLGDEHADRLVQRLADGVHVVGHAGEHVARRGAVVIPHREAVDLVRNIAAHGF